MEIEGDMSAVDLRNSALRREEEEGNAPHSNPVTGGNVGDACFCKPGMCSNFIFHQVYVVTVL